jgi:hypothetical protein
MQTPRKPVDKQASMFLTRKRRIETVQEALEGAVNHLINGGMHEHLARAFTGSFGPEPWVAFTVTIRRDPKDPGLFTYASSTKIGHELGSSVQFYGLKPE